MFLCYIIEKVDNLFFEALSFENLIQKFLKNCFCSDLEISKTICIIFFISVQSSNFEQILIKTRKMLKHIVMNNSYNFRFILLRPKN